MTYCVGMMLDKGLVLMSDTRTNSGVDNISVFRKMFYWSVPGDRIIALMTAGNPLQDSGGSFIVATGGTITTDGNYKVHTFTSSGKDRERT